MCTIIVSPGRGREVPLVVAANRDEFYARRATGPAVLCDAPRVIGGRDLEQGGSWLAAAETGLFVGLTNQRTFQPPDRSLRSRGEVVVEALRRRTVDEVRRYLTCLDARQFNPFNVVFGSAERVELAYARPDVAALELAPAPEGLCVLANDRLGSPHFPKTIRAAELVRDTADRGWEQRVEALQVALADHQLPELAALPAPPPHCIWPKELLQQLQALCIHTPAYGTRSSTILALEPGRVVRYLFAAGAPCSAPFEDVTHLLHAP